MPGARTVELAGDFNEWRATPLTRRPDGWWSIELSIEPGAYEMSIRLDGGPWIAPPGLTPIKDEFAGEGGILIVP
jgi:1,4-alpha-glucan branching enzyme